MSRPKKVVKLETGYAPAPDRQAPDLDALDGKLREMRAHIEGMGIQISVFKRHLTDLYGRLNLPKGKAL